MKALAVVYLIFAAMFFYASFIGNPEPLALGLMIMGLGALGTLLAIVALAHKP